MAYSYIIERRTNGDKISYSNRIYTFLDKDDKVKKSENGQEYIFESVGSENDGWRSVTINETTKGYLRSSDWELISFEAKNVGDIEHGFGIIEKFDGKFYFFNVETQTFDNTGYLTAFVIGPHTRVVGDDDNGWRVLFNKVSNDKSVSKLINKTFKTRQEAIWEASEFELNYQHIAVKNQNGAKILPVANSISETTQSDSGITI